LGTMPPPATGWVGLGPAPLVSDSNFFGKVSGRATSVAIDPSDPTGATVYVGGAYGGVWKSINATNADPTTVTWNPVTDQQASLATGAVSVKPDGTIVLVGTGEPNNAIDSYYGVGILRSADGGAHWTLISSADSGTHPFAGLGAAKFAWSTASPNTVVAAMATAAVGFEDGAITGSTNRGLYLSTNAGQTWAYQALTDGSAPISATDVVYNATAGKFFASIRSHGIYSSTNGTNWTRLANQPNPAALTLANCPTAAVSSGPLYRGQLTVVPGRNEMYVWFVDINDNDGGIWRSTDGGASAWTQISETGIAACGDSFGCGTQQAFYNLEIYGVPDGSATDLYAGAVNLFKCKLASGATNCSILDSTQGAKWINLTHVYQCPSIASVHPDEHELDFKIAGGQAIMYFANDGGVYRALDGFTGLVSGTCGNPNSFGDLNGPIGSMTQFVSFSVHPTDQNTVLGGTQDNGSPASSTATTSPQWITVNGGDGGFNAINPTTPTQWFSANTDVSIQVCNSGISCNTNTFLPVVTNGTVGGDAGPFYTPYILDPQNVGELLVGTCRVWRGTTGGLSFVTLSPNFDVGGNTSCTGGEINQVRSLAAGGPKVSNFSSVVYATTDGTGPNAGAGGGEVWVTTSAGTTQMTNKTGTTNPSNYTISSVAIDTSVANGQTAYVGIMGFGVGHVFKTTTAGGAWTNFTGSGLPDAPVNALLVDSSVSPAQIYAGTDVGVFVSSTTSAAWTEVGPLAQPGATGYLPNVPVSAIRLFNSGGVKKLRVSTYGRGVWEYNFVTGPDYQISISNTPQTVFPTQNTTLNGTLTALNGYASPVNLSCTGTPPATCAPSPAQVTPTAGGAAFTVTAGGVAGDYNFNAHGVGTDVGTVTHDAVATLHVVDFGLTVPNPNTITATQGGTSNATTFQVTASGAFAQSVILTCSAGLPLGASCNFSPSDTVNPTSGSPVTVTLTVSTTGITPIGNSTVTLQATTAGAPAPKTQSFTLQVIAPVPVVSLSATSLVFLNQAIGTTSPPQPVTLQNIGLGTLNIVNIAASGDFAQTNNCGSSVSPGASCTISVTFTPTVDGTRTGQVTLTDNAADSPQLISLTGLGGVAVGRVSPSSVAFGGQPLNTTSAAKKVSLFNDGDFQMTVSSVTTTGDFAVQTNNCVNGVKPGTHCDVFITFTPTQLGARAGTLTFVDSATNSPQTASLTGVGTSTTTTSLTSSPNPSALGQAVTLTAVVVPTFNGTPTGTVTFRDGTTTLGTIALNLGAAELVTSTLSGGSHSLTAAYNGDAVFLPSTSPIVTQVVKQGLAAVTLGSNPNPSFVNQPVSFTAVVTGVNGVVPTGSINIQQGGLILATVQLVNGQAVFSTAFSSSGTRSVTAVYSGDPNYPGATSKVLKQVVKKYATSTTVASSLNPSVYGEAVNLTAQVTSGAPNTPSGTVTFKSGGSALGTVPLVNGFALLTKTNLPAGSLATTAAYNGDGVNSKSTSSVLTQIVNIASTTTTLTSSPNPSALGQNVKFTATVTSPTTVPVGTVTFTMASGTLGTVSLAGGKAKLTVSTLPAGATTVTALYNGTSNINGSSGSVVQTVR